MRVDSELLHGKFQEVVAFFEGQDHNEAVASSKVELYAGPYEIYLSIQPLVDTIVAAVETGAGVTALLMELVRRKPDHPINVHVENSITVVIDGKRELSSKEIAQVEDLFKKYGSDPNDPDWHALGMGQSAGRGHFAVVA